MSQGSRVVAKMLTTLKLNTLIFSGGIFFILQTSLGYQATIFWMVLATCLLDLLASSSSLLPTRNTFPLAKMLAVVGGSRI